MRNPRQTIWRLLALSPLLPLFAALLLLRLADPAGAQVVVEGTDSILDQEPARLVPDVALIVDGGSAPLDAEVVGRLDEGLAAIDGVWRSTFEQLPDGGTVFYLNRLDGGSSRPLDAVTSEAEELISAQVPEAEVLVGGSAVADRALAARFATTTMALVILAGLIGAASGLIFGWKRGLLAAVALAVTVVCAGNIGGQVGGSFDGTMATTSLPGALAGLVVGVGLGLRLLIWFRTPSGVDGAETIRHSLLELLPELALLFSGLILASAVVELLNPGRSPLTVVAISALVAVVVLAALLAPGLTVLVDEPEGPLSRLPAPIPDGRDFPLLVLVSVGLVLAALSLFAYRQPATALLDARDLPAESEPALVTERLLVGGGDATTALVATKPESTSQVDFEGWAGVIVERPEVERVDTAGGRFLPTGRTEVEATNLLVPPGAEDAAVVVLNVGPRSEVGQEITAGLSAIPLAGGQPRFSGDAADAAGRAGSTVPIVVSVLTLALAAAVAVQVLTQNLAQSAIAFVLRIIGGGAVIGVYRLLISEASLAEILTVLVLMALAVGLFELEFLSLTGLSMSRSDHSGLKPGQTAAVALLGLTLAGLVVAAVSLLGGGPRTGRFGFGLLAAALVEFGAGLLLLRPALLGQRAAFHTAARPVRVAIHSGAERRPESSNGPEDPTWRRVVGDLLQAEFRLQSHPEDADLESVFVRDTPLYRQAATHHDSLAEAGLRIVGRSPKLRNLQTVSGRSPITLTVTVDHPERHLVDGEGNVVGVRKAERRSGVLWLSDDIEDSYRIAESVELGSVPLPEDLGPSADTDSIPGVMEPGPSDEHRLRH